MTTNDQTIGAQIQAKGLTAPRITPDDIEANIKQTYFFTAEEGAQGALAKNAPELGAEFPSISMLTFCVLVLRNGFTVTGESACASPENFDAELGRKIARQNAVQKIWPLMGYELRTKLSSKPTSDDEYRMQLKDIPLTVIADFVDDSEAVKGILASMPK